MAGGLYDRAYANIIGGEDWEDEREEREYNFKAYVSEPSCVEQAWGDLAAQVQYKDDTADHIAVLKQVITLQEPRTAAKADAPPAPASRLMQKLFKTAAEPAPVKPQKPSGPDPQIVLVTEKVEELNREVERLGKLKGRVAATARQIEEKGKLMSQEREEFESWEEAVKEETRQYCENERQKAERERRTRERNQKALAEMPSRRDREEKDALQGQIRALQEEAKARKARHQLAKARLLKQLEDSVLHSKELQEEKARMLQLMPQPPEQPVEAAEPLKASNPAWMPTEEHDDYTEVLQDGRVKRVFPDGHEENTYANGTKREMYQNGYSVTFFSNEDEKHDFPDGRSLYIYAQAKTKQMTHPNGLQVLYFSDGQKETHFPDGTRKVRFPDSTVKTISPNGDEKCVYVDGSVATVVNGVKRVEHPGGHVDVTYPDGSKMRQLYGGAIQRIG